MLRCEMYLDVNVREIFDKLGGVGGARQLLRGDAKFSIIKHTVDLSARPLLPAGGWRIYKHKGEGVVKIELRSDDNLYLDGKKVNLFLPGIQKEYPHMINGYELKSELIKENNKMLLNSNVLDYLYNHPEFFPKHWKKHKQGYTQIVFFWGSIFERYQSPSWCVRSLHYHRGKLHCGYRKFDNYWDYKAPLAYLTN